jgi:hypothetical protein
MPMRIVCTISSVNERVPADPHDPPETITRSEIGTWARLGVNPLLVSSFVLWSSTALTPPALAVMRRLHHLTCDSPAIFDGETLGHPIHQLFPLTCISQRRRRILSLVSNTPSIRLVWGHLRGTVRSTCSAVVSEITKEIEQRSGNENWSTRRNC